MGDRIDDGLWGLRRRLDTALGAGDAVVDEAVPIPRTGLVADAVELACALIVEGRETPRTVEVASLAWDAALREALPVVESMLREQGVPPTIAERRDSPPPSWLDFSTTNSESFSFDALLELRLPVEWAMFDVLPEFETRRVRLGITTIRLSASVLGVGVMAAGAVHFARIDDAAGHWPEVHCEISAGSLVGSDQDLRVFAAALLERVLAEVDVVHTRGRSAAPAIAVSDDLVVQLRVPFRPAEASWWLANTEDLLDALASALDAARLGGVDDIEEEGNEMCVYLLGSNPEAVLEVARQALTTFAIPSGAYALLPRTGQEHPRRVEI